MIFNKIYKNNKLITIASIVVIFTGGLILLANQKQAKERDLSSFTTFAESGSLPGLINTNGELQSKRSVNISPKRQGIIDQILVKAGDSVLKDQLLARMSIGDMTYRINERRSEYEKQKANFERRSYLYKEGAISKEEYDEYKNLFLISKARLDQLTVEQKELEIRAPFKGIITTKYAVPGAFVTPSKTIQSSQDENSRNTSIVELSQGLEVIAKVPESDIGRIQVGQSAKVRVDSFPEIPFKAQVLEISPRAIKNNNVTSFEVKLAISKPTNKLRIGMTADIEFQTGKTSIRTLVPTVAIVTRNGEPGLLFVGNKKQPQFKKIELGISSGSKTAIIKGVKPGDQIFIDLPPWSKQTQAQ